jgi:TRAP-type mannitol/chloroaromatic compound transport system permease small subunit
MPLSFALGAKSRVVLPRVPKMTNLHAAALTSCLATGADRIDRLIAAVGRTVMWFCLFLVLMQFAVVLMRYAFGIGWIWISESITYAHDALFLLAAAWTLQQNGHVRVDVFYSNASARGRAIIDLLGALFLLLPFMAVIVYFALPYVARSWSILERSRETSGLPFVYLLKTLIPLFAVLMGLQGISQAVRAVLLLTQQRVAAAAAETR